MKSATVDGRYIEETKAGSQTTRPSKMKFTPSFRKGIKKVFVDGKWKQA